MERSLITILLSFLVILSIIFGIFVLIYKNELEEVKAGSDDNVWGWAWSENIGWISFNNTSGGGLVDYGVDIAPDGIFSGYAWSENMGWISFNETELSGCPSGTCRAQMNLDNGEVSGWARVLSWEDGWIHLRGSNYGVFLNSSTKEFEGWAWGDTVTGWISFNCQNCEDTVCDGYPTCGDPVHPDYKVETNFSLPPTADNLSVDQGNYCAAPLRPILSWTFSDPDPSDTQGAYQAQIDNNFDFSSPEIDSCIPSPGTCAQGNSSESYSPSTPLSYNITYYWRLKVWDNQGIESTGWNSTGWIYPPSSGSLTPPPGDSFTTALHAYPDPDFNWFPVSPTEEEIVQFCSIQETGVCPQDMSACYDVEGILPAPSCSGKDFLWTFPLETEFATGSSAISSNPQVRFTTSGDKDVSLQITNDVGSCTQNKSIKVTLPLPKWKEVEP